MRRLFQTRPVFFLAALLASIPFLFSGPALGQKVGEPGRLQPRLKVPGAEEPVRLASLAIVTRIEGGFAESSLEMVFHNPNRRVLEGELEFPLAPGQEISGLALDINGRLWAAVAVDKARGQEVFDSIARRKVDPALLEATWGNAYRLRVYPLPAGGSRRVVLRVMQPLEAENGGLRYRLPLTFAERLDSISIEAEVVSPDGPARAAAGNLELSLKPDGPIYRGRVKGENISPEGWLDISLPAPKALPASVTAVRWQDKMYFSAAARLTAPDRPRPLPDRVTILWDASGSGLKRDRAGEMALLDRYFQAFGSGQARLVVLRDQAAPPRNFKIKNGNWSELKAAVVGLAYDGATNLKDWTPSADCREYLLFSDGLDNYQGHSGKRGFPEMGQSQRLYAVTSAATADYPTLRRLAAGGDLIDLAHDSLDSAEARLLREGGRVSLVNKTLAGGGQAALEPGSARLSPGRGPGRLVRLAGWAAKDGAGEVRLRLDLPDGGFQNISLPLPAWDQTPEADEDEAPLPARLWGRYAVSALEENHRVNQKAIARLAGQLGLVSRQTSLIVLETAADYAGYGVNPPAELRDQVAAIKRPSGALAGRGYLSDDQLLSLWRKKVEWWNTYFSVKKEQLAVAVLSKEEFLQIKSMVDDGEADNEVRTISAPRIMAANDQRVSIKQGRQTPYKSGSSANTAANVQSSSPPRLVDSLMLGGDPPAQSARRDDRAGGPAAESRSVGLSLKAWTPEAPGLAKMKEAKDDELYAAYLETRSDYLDSGDFFLDAADLFFERGLNELGRRVLSNLAELRLEDRRLLRLLAWRLMRAGEAAAARPVLERVRELAPYEPQSWRDLALALDQAGQFQAAADLLYETARRNWPDRFGDIKTIALTEMNAIIAQNEKEIKTAGIDPRLITNLAADIRVVLSWDADDADMDLRVIGPEGRTADYRTRLTAVGGRMSRNCSQGYGPEEFMLKWAAPGLYRVEVVYTGDSRQTLGGEVNALVTVFSRFGTPREERETTALRFKKAGDKALAAEFTVE